MQLTGELKEKVEKTKTKEEAKQMIEEAGMILDDAELDQVAGGKSVPLGPETDCAEHGLVRYNVLEANKSISLTGH